LFLASSGLFVFTKLTMRPSFDDSSLYHEFEDRDPRIARYNRYSRISIVGATIGALLLFLGSY